MDKHVQHEDFIASIHSKKKVMLTFFSQEDGGNLTRKCAPLDYGPSKRKGRIIDNGKNKYHFWDYDSDTKVHVLSITADVIKSMNKLDESFDPAEFAKDWNLKDNPWWIKRDWGEYS